MLNTQKVKDILGGNWWHYISPSFAFVNKFSHSLSKSFMVEENGVLINKKILDGDRYPSVRFCLLLSEDEKIEPYLLSKKEINKVMAQNFLDYVKQHEILPKCCEIARIQKGKAVVKYSDTKYDVFTLLKSSQKNNGDSC